MSFAGLSANTPFYNITTSVAMIVGRFGLAIPALALAGRLARSPRRTVTAGTLPTDGWLFGLFMIGTAVVIGGLSYLPALTLGPIAEQLMMQVH
jgi:K+-transporting ATPase ATPase A chain